MIPMEPGERASTRFRRLMKSRPLIVLGAYNPMSARIVEQAGLSAVYMTGYGTSLGSLFEDYRYWLDSTGADLSALLPHARATIDYWLHATVPTMPNTTKCAR